MTAPIVFCDVETVSLTPGPDVIWEVGAIEADGTEHHWFLPVDLGKADAYSLKVGHFYERYPDFVDVKDGITRRDDFATEFSRLTAGKHLVGAVVSFDEERLRLLLRANGACPSWHYHLVDVEALAVGYLAAKGKPVTPPWHSDELTAALGVKVDDMDKHTAIGDARWAKAIYVAVMEES